MAETGYFRKDRRERRVCSSLMAACLLILSISTCVSASQIYELAFDNTFTTGSVDIGLRQLETDQEGNQRDARPSAVMPGDHVSYMPQVENLRADAYVRIRIDIVMDKATEAPVSTSDVFSITDGWIQKGDYFYNTQIMKKGEKSIAFQGIIIPDNWVNDPENDLPAVKSGKTPAVASGFTIKAHADAIQSDNFRPDFGSDMPWGSVITETAKASDSTSYDIADPMIVTNEMSFSSSGGLEANTKNLFRNFQTYLAGNTYRDTLEITNNADHEITVYFRTRSKRTDLTEQMKLEIFCHGDKVYSGDLVSESMNRYTELVKLGPGQKTFLRYSVILPDKSKNYYSVLVDDVEWQFRVVEDTNTTKLVKTGDNTMFIFWLSVFTLSLVLLSALVTAESKRYGGIL